MPRYRLNALGAHLPPNTRELFYANLWTISVLGNTPTLMDANLQVNEAAVEHMIALTEDRD